jgi:hypothetical protein
MAQHGYLREYDDGWDRGDDRDRERSWRDDDRERGWRGSGGEWTHRDRGWSEDDRNSGDRNRNFMLGDRNQSSDRDRDRGFFGRMGDDARSWFRDDDRQYRGTHQDDWDRRDRGSSGYGREHGFGGSQGEYRQSSQHNFGGRGDWERSPRNFSSHQDDHYRSWRDRQMNALDRDYEDYCREREQQFHQDFDSWRSKRQGRGSGSQQTGHGGRNDEMELTAENELTHARAMAGQGNTPSPEGAATLGTNNSENSGTGRGKGQA